MSSTVAVDSALARMLASCSAQRPWVEQDEGPYHREAQLTRRDVVEDRQGAAMQLGVRITDSDGEPVTKARVEVWHCDALGRYSGFPPPDPSTPVTATTASRVEYLPDQTFRRGRQATDAAGIVEFRTIYPGWYPGRTVHVHLMVHLGDVVLTSQLYFPEDVTDRVFVVPPYSDRPGRDTTNNTDEIFSTGGEPAILDVAVVGVGYRAGVCLSLPATAPMS